MKHTLGRTIFFLPSHLMCLIPSRSVHSSFAAAKHSTSLPNLILHTHTFCRTYIVARLSKMMINALVKDPIKRSQAVGFLIGFAVCFLVRARPPPLPALYEQVCDRKNVRRPACRQRRPYDGRTTRPCVIFCRVVFSFGAAGRPGGREAVSSSSVDVDDTPRVVSPGSRSPDR